MFLTFCAFVVVVAIVAAGLVVWRLEKGTEEEMRKLVKAHMNLERALRDAHPGHDCAKDGHHSYSVGRTWNGEHEMRCGFCGRRSTSNSLS